ncbi:MAG: HEAT repeat domain-containing protein [Planctomycetes bacterium]|nr:HEAT repeat domain-containing protein [Planctomycetota bacterium]
MRKMCLVLAVSLSAVAASAAAQAPSPARSADPVRLARLITDLGSNQYEVRVEANQALAELGPAARGVLETALKSDDPEVRLRAGELLRRVKIEELLAPSRIAFPTARGSAGKLIAQLSEQAGNHVMLGDQYGGFHDKDIELEQPSGTFWPLLDEICRKSEHRVRAHYDTRQPGLVVIDGGQTSYPTAYSGPVRAQIISARRNFSEDLDYEQVTSERSHTFQVTFALVWEDRFRLVAYRAQPELVSALTDKQTDLAATPPAASGWNVAGSGTRQVTMSMRLHPPVTTAKQLDTFHLRWGVMAVGDYAALEVSDLTPGKIHQQDDVELQIESLPTEAAARCEVCVVVHREQMVTEPRDVVFQEYEFDLFDTDGRMYRRQSQTNSFADDGARSKLTFQAESPGSKPGKLRFSYPRLRAERNLEIVFRDVPLPRARPE